MAKTSILVPSRNERYLVPTIRDVFSKARGEIEVVAVLEGYWPEGWQQLCDQHENLHTIHHSEPKGMRPAINAAAASAISRGTKYLLKLDAHCMVAEGFDEVLKADCDKDWIVVPRRKRLDPEKWAVRDDNRPDIDYHYLSFPDNVRDFGGPGLNGKVWAERAKERFGKPEFDIDDEMSSQGSGWFMHAEYFQRMGFMDAEHYGPFWNEFQELGLSCWLSGGQVKVNKKTWYAHWHKGSAGRGYHLPKDWLNTGATFTKKWLFNEASSLQTRPFKWIIEHFWPVPTWPESWEDLVYGSSVAGVRDNSVGVSAGLVGGSDNKKNTLTIHTAYYGIPNISDRTKIIDVTARLRECVVNNSLDIMVTNESLKVGNPFRGQRKSLWLTYSYDGGKEVYIEKQERDWLIIGQSARYVKQALSVVNLETAGIKLDEGRPVKVPPGVTIHPYPPQVALNDKLIRRFNVTSHRLRAPMPIEIRDFHRDDLAKLFAELGFKRGAEIGVAEGNYSEVLCKFIPNLELLCVDPWHHYSDNAQHHSKEHHEFSYNETVRKLQGYNAKLIPKYSMDAVRDVADGSLDFVYLDGNHSFNYVMQDLIEWSKKVRSGGIVAGDDYMHLNPKWGAGPVEAVKAYTEAHRISPWFICSAHKSVDYFWVKP